MRGKQGSIRQVLAALFPILLLVAGLPARAELAVGVLAPDFTAPASLGGKQFQFTLTEALKTGPVVLYFYPAAFTSGCTAEAHAFAEATEQFKALGATVIGISKDDIATLDKFSVSECRSKFAVAADPDLKIIKAYDAKLPLLGMATRTSFVITPDDRIAYEYSSLSPSQHVANTMAAVQAWKDRQK